MELEVLILLQNKTTIVLILQTLKQKKIILKEAFSNNNI